MGIWFGFITIALTIPFIWFMPKRLSRKEIYITWGWMATLTINTDLIFGLIFDLYDFVNPPVTMADLALQFLLAPSAAIIILNFMPWPKRQFSIYLIGMTLAALCYEALSLQTGYLIYKGWRTYYSIPIYALGIIYLRFHLTYLRNKR